MKIWASSDTHWDDIAHAGQSYLIVIKSAVLRDSVSSVQGFRGKMSQWVHRSQKRDPSHGIIRPPHIQGDVLCCVTTEGWGSTQVGGEGGEVDTEVLVQFIFFLFFRFMYFMFMIFVMCVHRPCVCSA